MARSGETMAKAEEVLAGVRGGLAALLTLRRGPTEKQVRLWVTKLRKAADLLEELLK